MWGYSPQGLFSDLTVCAVRRAVSVSGVFFVTAGIILWTKFCRSDSDAFITRYVNLYDMFLDERRKAFDADYSSCKVANRLLRVHPESKVSSHLSRSECGSDVGSSASSVSTAFQKKSVSGPGSSAITVVKSSSGCVKSPVKGAGCSSMVGSKTHVSGSKADAHVLPKKSKKPVKKEVDPSGFHKLKKPAKK